MTISIRELNRRKKISDTIKNGYYKQKWEKGHVPWNKGVKNCFSSKSLIKRTETRRKTDGYRRTKEQIEAVRLKHLGRKNTPETIEKMKQSAKERAGKYGMPSGEKSPNWQGGKTKESTLIRHSQKYKEWSRQVLIRDDFICQDCGIRGGYLEAHHIKLFSVLLREAMFYFPEIGIYDAGMLYSPLWDISNGKTLCGKCHNKTRGNNVNKSI